MSVIRWTGRLIPVPATPEGLAERLEQVWAEGDAALLVERSSNVEADAGLRRLRLPAGTAVVLQTSGSTKAPRYAVLSHAALAAATSSSLERLAPFGITEWLLALPAHHVAGLMVVLRAHMTDAPLRVLDGSGDLSAIEAAAGACVSLVPTQLHRALAAGVHLSDLACLLIGGGPTSPADIRTARDQGANVVMTYGMTETCGGCVYDGVPLSGVQVRVADGRVELKGPMLFDGYLEEQTIAARRTPDGWFRTSDTGALDGGILAVHGRADDTVLSGGLNIPLGPVIDRLLLLPGVRDATAIPVPDPEWGSVIRAVLVVDPDTELPLTAVRVHVQEYLPKEHAPFELLLVETLGRDTLGKLAARQRSEFAARPPTERWRPGASGTHG